MKLATYKDGSRDGQLVVVSRDLRFAHYATGIADNLQQVLDDWNFMAPQLQDVYTSLNRSADAISSASRARHGFAFDPRQCMAPLPRAYQRVDGAAFVNQVHGVSGAGAAGAPVEPLLSQGNGSHFLGPLEDVESGGEADGMDFEAELAVVIGDVGRGVTAERALEGIRLVMLANKLSLRHRMPAAFDQRFGQLQGQPAIAYSPVAVTLDELGEAWDQGRLHLTLQNTWNGRKVGMCEAGTDMVFHFGQLIAQLCQTRAACAGTIIGSGAVSNRERSRGYSCIAEKRAIEALQDGQPSTGFMQLGDRLRIEMKGRDGQTVFGAIEQTIVPLESGPAGRAPR